MTHRTPSSDVAPTDGQHSSEHLLPALRDAVARSEISVAYQPQVDLRTGEMVAVEALARWHHPSLGTVPPDDFIPVAERNGLLDAITDELLATAARDCKAWHDAGHPIELAVNIAAEQLIAESFDEHVAETLAEAGLPLSALTVEVTQSQLIDDYERAAAPLERLAALGVDVSIDDYGTGYSSIERLTSLPTTEVKIGREFVGSPVASSLIDIVISLAESHGLRVVAEGVETQQQLDLVHRLGCDRAQGYLFSAPVPAERILELLSLS